VADRSRSQAGTTQARDRLEEAGLGVGRHRVSQRDDDGPSRGIDAFGELSALGSVLAGATALMDGSVTGLSAEVNPGSGRSAPAAHGANGTAQPTLPDDLAVLDADPPPGGLVMERGVGP
jgi:hypothetical protein